MPKPSGGVTGKEGWAIALNNTVTKMDVAETSICEFMSDFN